MTTQTVLLDLYDYGASTVTVTVNDPDTLVLTDTADSVTKNGVIGSRYSAVFTRVSVLPAGLYAVGITVNGIPGLLYCTLAGTNNETVSARLERAAVLDAAIESQLDRIEANTGTGARTVTITVNDGATVLQNARVRITEGVNSYSYTTNASGVVVFNVDDASFTVAIAKSGYTYAGTTLVVDGNETVTYSMTATSVTSPTNPDLSAIEVLCLDEDFAAASGIDVDFRMAAVATGDQNRAHPGTKKTVTSNGSGIARFEGPQGSTIEWKRGNGQQWTAVTLDNDSVTNVTSLIGSP